MLRSAPLKRKTPLRRTKMKRSKRRPNPAGSDPAHLAWIRSQPCCWCGISTAIEAHHSTVGRGLSRKSGDREAMPLCWMHHAQFHCHTGPFAGWTKAQRRAFQNEMVSRYAPGENTV